MREEYEVDPTRAPAELRGALAWRWGMRGRGSIVINRSAARATIAHALDSGDLVELDPLLDRLRACGAARPVTLHLTVIEGGA